jgi:hypothetical protein
MTQHHLFRRLVLTVIVFAATVKSYALGQSVAFTLNTALAVTASFQATNGALTVYSSSPDSGVVISSSTGHGGTTTYQLSVPYPTQVSLTAPATAGGNNFTGWTGLVSSTNRTITFIMTSPIYVTANYQAPNVALTVYSSSPDSGVVISSSTGHGGTTTYQLSVPRNTPVTLTAPATAGGNNFKEWTGAISSTDRTINLTMDTAKYVTAVYQAPNVALSVYSSNPDSGVVISSSTGHGGTTSYQLSVPRNTNVSLTAPATAGGNPFSGWTGAVTSGNQTINVTMDNAKYFTANYTTPPDYTLSVNSSGASGVGISSSTGHGGTTNYTKSIVSGTSVTLTAPGTAGGLPFTGWTGDVTSSSTSITFTMNGTKTVTANYAAPSYTLTVNSSGASGVVITGTNGCGGTTNYTKSVTSGTSVTLTAPPTASGNSFNGWTGAVTSGSQTITFTMTGPKALTVNYQAPNVAVTVYSSGASSVPISSSTGHGGTTDYYMSVPRGTTIALTAPATASVNNFNGWSGAVTDSNQTITFTADAPKAVTANYQAPNVTLTVYSSGASNVVIGSSTGHDGTTTYQRIMPRGTTVTLTAPATAGGNNFSGWTDGVTSSDQTITFTMDSAKYVTANYATPIFTLHITSTSGGHVSQPGEGNFRYSKGASVRLEATPEPGYYFTHWSGNFTTTSNPAILIMDQDYDVTANYDKESAEIVAFVPPKGAYNTFDAVKAAVTVKNLSKYPRSFWVSLKYAHETATTADTKKGWLILDPIQTSVIPPNSLATVESSYTLVAGLCGQYYASASVWDNYNAQTGILSNHLDETVNHKWSKDRETGMESFFWLFRDVVCISGVTFDRRPAKVSQRAMGLKAAAGLFTYKDHMDFAISEGLSVYVDVFNDSQETFDGDVVFSNYIDPQGKTYRPTLPLIIGPLVCRGISNLKPGQKVTVVLPLFQPYGPEPWQAGTWQVPLELQKGISQPFAQTIETKAVPFEVVSDDQDTATVSGGIVLPVNYHPSEQLEWIGTLLLFGDILIYAADYLVAPIDSVQGLPDSYENYLEDVYDQNYKLAHTAGVTITKESLVGDVRLLNVTWEAGYVRGVSQGYDRCLVVVDVPAGVEVVDSVTAWVGLDDKGNTHLVWDVHKPDKRIGFGLTTDGMFSFTIREPSSPIEIKAMATLMVGPYQGIGGDSYTSTLDYPWIINYNIGGYWYALSGATATLKLSGTGD